MPTTSTLNVCDHVRTSVAEMPGTWWVAQTQSQYEQRLADELAAAGVNYFLPKAKTKVQPPSGRSRHKLVPLFPGYVFLNGGPDAQYEARRSRATLSLIRVVQQDRLAKQLADIEQALLANAHLHAHTDLVVGRRVRVTAGPLKNVEGELVIRQDRQQVFLLKAILMSTAVSLRISPDLLEAV